jgi:L-rhamnose mutarotase
MRLRDGAFDEYVERHQAVWPELLEEIGRAGVQRMMIYVHDESTVFVYSEVTDEDTWKRLWESEIHRRWGELMEPLLEFGQDGLIASSDLVEVFAFERGL